MQLSELMNLCTRLQEKVLDLGKAKNCSSKEIAFLGLKRKVKQLEKKRKLRTPGLKRLRKISSNSRLLLLWFEATNSNAPNNKHDGWTLALELIEIKAAKPKVVTFAATTTTTTRLKARGVVVQEPSEFKATSSPLQASKLLQAKDKGKAIMVEPERPLKKKD
ncbi:hypothetical protein Tco_0753190 [Tanacetum coccineum]